MHESQTIEAQRDPLDMYMTEDTIFIELRPTEITEGGVQLLMHNIRRALSQPEQHVSIRIGKVTGCVQDFVQALHTAVNECGKEVIRMDMPQPASQAKAA